MPPRRRRRSSGVDTIDDIRREIVYLYNQWQSKTPQKADNAKRGYLARQKLLDLQNKLNKRIREEDEEANRRNEALGNLSPQSMGRPHSPAIAATWGRHLLNPKIFHAPGAAYSDL
jgi:hypothetical protein